VKVRSRFGEYEVGATAFVASLRRRGNTEIVIFGKTDDIASRKVSEETVTMVCEYVNNKHNIVFIDMNDEEGMKVAEEKNIYYIPTVVVNDDNGEIINYLENSGDINSNQEGKFNIKDYDAWGKALETFIQEVMNG